MARIIRSYTVTPTIDTSIYAAGDVIHSSPFTIDLSLFRDQPDLFLDQAVLVDAAKQSAALDVALFSATVASQTLNTAFAPTDAEALTCVAWFPLTTYSAWSVNSVAIASGLRRSINMLRTNENASMTLYGFLISRGTPTYAAATDLALTLQFLSLGESH